MMISRRRRIESTVDGRRRSATKSRAKVESRGGQGKRGRGGMKREKSFKERNIIGMHAAGNTEFKFVTASGGI